ncbi:MAG: hypothetical protein ABFR90_07155 [Planctomycetota bacterium]
MKTTRSIMIITGLAVLLCSTMLFAEPMGTAFTYQGRLLDGNVAADGAYDIQFKLYDDPNVLTASQIGSAVDANDMDVVDGYFVAELDFGSNVFGADARWLEVAVRPGASTDPNDYVALNPLQKMTAAPYALKTRGIAVDENHNVGIGTETPVGKLDVATAMLSINLDQSQTVQNLSTSNSSIWQSFTPSSTSRLMQISFVTRDAKDNIANWIPSDAVLTIYQGEGVSGSILCSQSIILSGDDWTWRYYELSNPPSVESGQTYTFEVVVATGESDRDWIRYATSNAYPAGRFYLNTIYDLEFQTYMEVYIDKSALTVDSDGNVGIGTTSPSRALQIGTVTAHSEGMIRLESRSGTNSSVYRSWEVGVPETGNDASGVGYSFIIDDTMNATDAELFIQYSTGNVGIGTIDPVGKLDVNGSIYQRGGVLHADYVFEPDYQLESIDEHSAFMWKQKHLPAIPKATIDAAGQEIVEVGSHRKGIVEELEKAHIYIEQLHQKNQALEKRLAEQETRLESLEHGE